MSKVKKIRLDQLLVERGLIESRSKAQAVIMAGNVFSGETKLQKAGQQVKEDIPLEVRGKEHPWVSRGGLKLVKGLESSEVNPEGMICLDVGASTGGFTDVLLTNGAKKVYAVDVGYGQLAHKIRVDERVVVLERTNARYLTHEQIPEKIDLIVCDASFIGLQTVLPAPMSLVADNAFMIALIKPQFEVGKSRVGKGGVVRDTALHEEVCNTISEWINSVDGWQVNNLVESPITGPQGNHEFLVIAEYRK